MSSNDANVRKRKPTIIPGTVSSNSGRNPKEAYILITKKFRDKYNTRVATEKATIANTVSSAADKQEEAIESIGVLIQDLSHPDNAKVNATLDALHLDLRDLKKNKNFVTAGGCYALVQLGKDRLGKAIAGIPACDQVTEWNEHDDLTALYKTLGVMSNSAYHVDESRAGISSVGGVEAVLKVMETFPKCQALQGHACAVLGSLVDCSIGRKKAVASGGFQLLLAAVNNHLDSANLCEYACYDLSNMIEENKEQTKLLIKLGGASAIAKVKEEWPDDDDVQEQVQRLAKLIGTEMNSWADEE
jgi:hypothetical protein